MRLLFEVYIKPLIKIEPLSTVTIRSENGEIGKSDIFIYAGIDKPLELKPASFNLEGKVSYVLETIEEGRKYKVSFQNAPEIERNYNGYLKFNTNYKEKPKITIRIHSRFKRGL